MTVTDVQQTAELYFSKLQSTPNTPYDQNFYDDINSRLAVLRSRAASLPKYPIVVEQLANLKAQFDTFQKLDKSSPRPFPGIAVTDAESAIAISVESILKLELALKRGVPPPPAGLLLAMQTGASRNVLLTLQGLALLAVEEAINAALNVVKSAVNTALGFALIA